MTRFAVGAKCGRAGVPAAPSACSRFDSAAMPSPALAFPKK